MKMMEGLCSLAKENRFFTSLVGRAWTDVQTEEEEFSVGFVWFCIYCVFGRPHFSLSPSHLDTRSEEEMEKKVELLASVATALAR